MVYQKRYYGLFKEKRDNLCEKAEEKYNEEKEKEVNQKEKISFFDGLIDQFQIDLRD